MKPDRLRDFEMINADLNFGNRTVVQIAEQNNRINHEGH
jgi:hypothetical protein